LPWKTRVALKCFTVLKYFYHSGFLSNLRLPWKQSLPEFTVLNVYFLSFKIFEQLALALKTGFALKFFKTGGGRPPDPHLVRLWLWALSKIASLKCILSAGGSSGKHICLLLSKEWLGKRPIELKNLRKRSCCWRCAAVANDRTVNAPARKHTGQPL